VGQDAVDLVRKIRAALQIGHNGQHSLTQNGGNVAVAVVGDDEFGLSLERFFAMLSHILGHVTHSAVQFGICFEELAHDQVVFQKFEGQPARGICCGQKIAPRDEFRHFLEDWVKIRPVRDVQSEGQR